jgi:molecular chaperone GrpE
MAAKKSKIEIATPDEVERYAAGSGPGNEAAKASEQTDAASAADAGRDDAQSAEAPGRSELAELREKWLRAKAELQNYQRRVGQEHAESLKYANAEFARSLLVVLDDMERLLEHASESDKDALVAGFQLIHDNLLKALRQHSVERIEAAGQPFDPAWHEAMMQQPSETHDEPTVLQEVQKGYRLHERVLRPAKVIVSKPPGQAAPASGEAGAPETKPGDGSQDEESE